MSRAAPPFSGRHCLVHHFVQGSHHGSVAERKARYPSSDRVCHYRSPKGATPETKPELPGPSSTSILGFPLLAGLACPNCAAQSSEVFSLHNAAFVPPIPRPPAFPGTPCNHPGLCPRWAGTCRARVPSPPQFCSPVPRAAHGPRAIL